MRPKLRCVAVSQRGLAFSGGSQADSSTRAFLRIFFKFFCDAYSAPSDYTSPPRMETDLRTVESPSHPRWFDWLVDMQRRRAYTRPRGRRRPHHPGHRRGDAATAPHRLREPPPRVAPERAGAAPRGRAHGGRLHALRGAGGERHRGAAPRPATPSSPRWRARPALGRRGRGRRARRDPLPRAARGALRGAPRSSSSSATTCRPASTTR